MKLNYVILYVSNAVETLEFYKKAFGTKERFIHESNQYAEAETGSTILAFANNDFIKNVFSLDFEENSVNKKPGGFQISLIVDDVQKSLDRAVSAGAVLLSEPKIMPWGFEAAFVRDLNGIIVEICKHLQKHD